MHDREVKLRSKLILYSILLKLLEYSSPNFKESTENQAGVEILFGSSLEANLRQTKQVLI